MSEQLLAAELTWSGGRFVRGLGVRVGANGRIVDVAPLVGEPTRRLDGRALMPGFVNAHSHAFQRGLRGHGETFPTGAGSFWSWREAMYGLVAEIDPDRFSDLCRQAFGEMLAAGITTVGEFHYLHHAGDGHDFLLDRLILRAAADAGIRIVLLVAYYRTGGFGKPLEGAQQRFGCASVGAYWRHLDGLARHLDERTQSLGVVAHSLRAVPVADLQALHRGAVERGLVFHLHIEEQRREIDDCLEAHGQRPMALLLDRCTIGAETTAVHCTHTAPEDMERFAATGASVCICPLTEANLGDGIADVAGIRAAGARICLGSDSNARISMLEEMRWLEYVQRLAGERRGVCLDGDGRVGPVLLDSGAGAGARALGVQAGALAAGHHADLMTIDLTAPALSGWRDETLADTLVCGAADDVVSEVCVAGRWLG